MSPIRNFLDRFQLRGLHYQADQVTSARRPHSAGDVRVLFFNHLPEDEVKLIWVLAPVFKCMSVLFSVIYSPFSIVFLCLLHRKSKGRPNFPGSLHSKCGVGGRQMELKFKALGRGAEMKT